MVFYFFAGDWESIAPRRAVTTVISVQHTGEGSVETVYPSIPQFSRSSASTHATREFVNKAMEALRGAKQQLYMDEENFSFYEDEITDLKQQLDHVTAKYEQTSEKLLTNKRELEDLKNQQRMAETELQSHATNIKEALKEEKALSEQLHEKNKALEEMIATCTQEIDELKAECQCYKDKIECLLKRIEELSEEILATKKRESDNVSSLVFVVVFLMIFVVVTVLYLCFGPRVIQSF